ncbi:MAG: selenocysteine-specific translation elongation factor [Planctomycetota bacterium]
MEYILISTAGHVDHGKSTLIKALSGIDPDRLKEEKEREMTIDIGFANFLLPSGRCAQVIDVPGHERFIKNMLTGINTVDLVLFLVDANESIKPQTLDHFNILKLLDFKVGIIVLTKIDLVNQERLEETMMEVAELVKDSFLENAPVIKVSAVTGTGITELVQTIDRLVPDVQQRNRNLPVRLPVDRVFTMSGSGTVITGTLVSGILKINDPLEILPQKGQVRVRQIQSYGGKAPQAVAGQRVGINLAGVKKEDLVRGNTLAAPGYIEPTSVFDAAIEVTPDSLFPLKNYTRLRLHIGTGEFLGRIILLDKDRLEPGQRGLIQFKSEAPLAIVKDDRFILRLYAPIVVVGGGRVMDAHPTKHKRFQDELIQQLEALESASPEESVGQVLINAGLNILKITEIIDKVNLPRPEVENIIKGLVTKGEIINLPSHPDHMMHIQNFDLLKEKIVQILGDFHKNQPLKLNIPDKEIKIKLGAVETMGGFIDKAINELAKENKVSVAGNSLRLASHAIQLNPKQEQSRQKIEMAYLSNLFGPPGFEAMTQALGIKSQAASETIAALKEMGLLVSLPDGIIMHQSAIAKASELIKDYLSKHENIKAGDFAKLLPTSRKYAIPLLEYLDSIKLTKRVGDVRILADKH